MIKSKFLSLLLLLSFFTILITPSKVIAENSWILIHKGRETQSDVYYNKETIRNISNNITEVFIKVVFSSEKYSIQQTRIDCMKNKTATGVVNLYVGSINTQRFNYSNSGWIWLDPQNEVDNKLFKVLCERRK